MSKKTICPAPRAVSRNCFWSHPKRSSKTSWLSSNDCESANELSDVQKESSRCAPREDVSELWAKKSKQRQISNPCSPYSSPLKEVLSETFDLPTELPTNILQLGLFRVISSDFTEWLKTKDCPLGYCVYRFKCSFSDRSFS